MIGLSVVEFEALLERLRPCFILLEASKKSHGRTSHLPTLEDKLLYVLVYYRSYITHLFLGYLFNLHNASICRLLKKMEPFLAKKISIKKDRSLTEEKLHNKNLSSIRMKVENKIREIKIFKISSEV